MVICRYSTIAKIVVVSLLPLAISGCDDDAGDTDSDVDTSVIEKSDFQVPFVDNDWECTQAHATYAADWFDEAWAHSARTAAVDHDELVELDGPTLDDRAIGVTIEITNGKVSVDDRSVGSIDEVLSRPDDLTRHFRMAWSDAQQDTLFDDDTELVIGVAVAQDVVGADVHQILQHLIIYAHDTPFVALFEAPWPDGLEPIPDAVGQRVHTAAAIPPHQTRNSPLYRSGPTMVSAGEEAVEDCPEMAEKMQAVSAADDRRKPQAMREALVGGWVECQCRADAEYILALFAQPPGTVLASFSPLIVEGRSGHMLALADDEEVSIRSDESWHEIAPDSIDDSAFERALEPQPVDASQ